MRGLASDSLLIWITLLFVIIELITYMGVSNSIKNSRARRVFVVIYRATALFVLFMWFFAYGNIEKIKHTESYSLFYFVNTLLILNYIPKIVLSFFITIAFIIRFSGFKRKIHIIVACGIIIWFGLSLSIIYGIFIERKIIAVENITVPISSLPEELNGLKIVQISDLHLASFNNNRFLERCVKKVNDIQPDLLFFTGDIVNNHYREMFGFESQMTDFEAKYGKFAILGNHDYGNYADWKTPEDKLYNNEKIKEMLIKAGFNLLRNEACKLEISGTSLYVIGTEDWGHREHHNYSNLDKAMEYVDNESFRILLAHNPQQWREQILPETNIPLTLSGHTHGGQAGFKIAGMHFSFMQIIEKNWGGLYHADNQYLYVNRGLGCVGALCRVGMKPEITTITLKSATKMR